MRLYYTEEMEKLRRAQTRAIQQRSAWMSAGVDSRDKDLAGQVHAGVVLAARAAAGRAIVGLGQRVFPGDLEPCNEA
jgi:hypothetical protein